MEVRREGAAEWHHFRSLYEIPEGPGVDLLDVQERLQETSSSDMGAKSRAGRGAGSEGSESGIGFGTMGKNRSDRTWRRSV